MELRTNCGDEYNKMRFLLDQNPNVNIVYISCDPIYAHVSSSAYKKLEKIKEGSGYKYLAREIEQKIQ
jgi:hypothetical protein